MNCTTKRGCGAFRLHILSEVWTKPRKNEALIRNDGMYVISGIFSRANACKKVKARRAEVPSTRSAQSKAAKRLEARGAHEARALWAKQRVVSPMRQGAPQASLRAMRNDHAELWPRPKGVRSAGTPRRREGGQMPTRPRQFGGRSPEICRAVPARRQRRVRGRNRRERCEDTEHRASEAQCGANAARRPC